MVEEKIMAITNELFNAVRLMQQGNEQGFNYVYSQTYNYVYARAKYIMQDEQDAIDLLQETYIQAYRSILSLDDPNNIYAWLGSITYNQGMKIFRKKKEVLLDEEAEGLFDIIEDDNIEWSPEESVDKNETATILMGIIDELPPLQKSALVAFYYDNMKIEQIAQAEGCSANTIKSRLNYAKKYIKSRVEEMQNQGGYKLYSINIPAVLLAIWWLSNQAKNTLSPVAAGNIYQATKFKIMSYAAQSSAQNMGNQGQNCQQPYGNMAPQQMYGNQGVTAGAVKAAKKGFSVGKAIAGIGITAAVATGGVLGYDAVTGEPFGIFVDEITDDELQAAVGTYTGETKFLFVLRSDVSASIRYDENGKLKLDVTLDNNGDILKATMEEPYVDGDKLIFQQTSNNDHFSGYITMEDDGNIRLYLTISGAKGSTFGNTKVKVCDGVILTKQE